MTYIKGTQEQLDAAKDDTTLLPFGVVFLSVNDATKGREVQRLSSYLDRFDSVKFVSDIYSDSNDIMNYDYLSSKDLEVIK